jgi:hypothetical protein
MFKYAMMAGIAGEWLFGASVATLEQLAVASLRALMLMLLAWMILESLRALFAAVMTFSDRA